MKLLSSPQGASKLQLDTASQERRLLELNDLIVQKRKELDQLDKDFVHTLSLKGAQNYEEEQQWQEKIRTLTHEVEALESRKKSALIPLQEREKKIDTKISVLLQREEEIRIKESDLEYTNDKLLERLDEVSERELQATDYAQLLTTREMNIALKEKETQARTDALVAILKESFDEISQAKIEADRRKAILKGRDISISEREKLVAQAEASFENRELKILDQYRTLQRAITETNLKNDHPRPDSHTRSE